MKRIVSLASVAAALVFGMCQYGVSAQNADYYCPPGAKFCPTPGSSAVADSGFGMGGYAPSGAPAGNAYFESQLNEGEQLIMVAPGGGYAAAPSPAPAYMTNPFAAAPAYPQPDAHAGLSDGLRGFVPPPPGSRPSPSRPEPSYHSGYSSGYAAAPAPGPAPLTADAFQAPYPDMSVAPVRRQPESRPADHARVDDGYARAAPAAERAHPYQNVSAQDRKTRAERLSEVANETSRRSDGKLDLKPRPENRQPWWKAWAWWKDDDDPAGKKTRAEIKAERREAKLAAKKAKEDARNERN